MLELSEQLLTPKSQMHIFPHTCSPVYPQDYKYEGKYAMSVGDICFRDVCLLSNIMDECHLVHYIGEKLISQKLSNL